MAFDFSKRSSGGRDAAEAVPRTRIAGTLALAVVAVATCSCSLFGKSAKDEHVERMNAMMAEQRVADEKQRQQWIASLQQAAKDRAAVKEEREASERRKQEEAARQREGEARRQLEQFEHACRSSQAERLADLSAQVRRWQKWVKRMKPYAQWVDDHCGVEDTRGVLVSRERTRDGVIVRTKPVGAEDDITCDATRPGGLTANDVELLIRMTKADVLCAGEFCTQNETCSGVDASTLGIPLVVGVVDFDMQKKVLVAQVPDPDLVGTDEDEEGLVK